MIGKPIKGKSFGGCVRYVVNRPEAAILKAEGVRMEQTATIIADFDMQRRLNPGLGKAVGHTILSWSEQDKAILNDALMMAMAERYMHDMKITDTQYLIVKHTDRDHPHVHIIFNRVDNNGKTISDQNDYARNVKVCRKLTEAYGLHIAAGKDKVNRHRLKAGDQQRYQIYDILKEDLKHTTSWAQLQNKLQQKGITILFKYKSGTKEVQGISFEKDGIQYKGSAIDRSMSFAGIEKQLKQNTVAQKETVTDYTLPVKIQPSLTIPQKIVAPIEELLGGALMLAALLPLNQEPDQEPAWPHPIKKKKRRLRM